ncbi:MAG: LacI family transcriptional regulator [Phycisphaerae bacterium]|nr:LacI family transcriptional regulator [Phycisphaerae bacterium]
MPKGLANTKHFRLTCELRQQVGLMMPGTPLPTVSELRKRFSASQSTVERAMSVLKRDGLVHRPAGKKRLLVSKISPRALHRIALIRSDYPSEDFEALCRAVVDAAVEKNWLFDLVNFRDQSTLDLEWAIGDNDAGVFLPTSESVFPAHIVDALRWKRKPIVVLQESAEEFPVGNILVDNDMVGRLAMEHLIDLGHKKIALVLDQPHDSMILPRVATWRRMMSQMKIAEDNIEGLFVDCGVQPMQDALRTTYNRFGQWLDKPHAEFTAIFCTSCKGAMAVLRALRERNIEVPGQVSVIAFAGEASLSDFFSPPLTTIEIETATYGQAVIETIEQMFTSPDRQPQQIQVEPYLSVRQSTKRI